jgi:glycosyltransferase involved in cell wall biosynthesis
MGQHERTALVVPPRDWVALADAIAQFLGDPPFAEMIGAAGAATARARLNQETMIGSLYAWCTEIYATWATTAY